MLANVIVWTLIHDQSELYILVSEQNKKYSTSPQAFIKFCLLYVLSSSHDTKCKTLQVMMTITKNLSPT